MIKQFEVYDRHGVTVFTGDARECCKFLGMSDTQFRRCVEAERLLSRMTYRIAETSWVDKAAAKRWDDFVAPIRARYGVKAKRSEDVK